MQSVSNKPVRHSTCTIIDSEKNSESFYPSSLILIMTKYHFKTCW